MEELSEALKAVEMELNLARKAYTAIIYLYWAVAFPIIYLLSIMAERAGFSMNSATVLFSALAIVLFAVEELRASRKMLHLRRVLGIEEKPNKGYFLAQLIVWPVAIVLFGLEGSWLGGMLGIGSGMLALALVDLVFLRELRPEKVVTGLSVLVFSAFYSPALGGAYASLSLGAGFGLGAYLTLMKAVRE